MRNPRRHRLRQVMIPDDARRREACSRLNRNHPSGVAVFLDVFVEHVDLPHRVVGIVRPELRLQRITAGDAVFASRLNPRHFHATLNVDELVGCPHAQADMIEIAAVFGARPGRQRQDNRRLFDLELRVVRIRLRRLDPEQRAVERNRSREVRNVERNVKLPDAGGRRCRGGRGHGADPSERTCRCGCTWRTAPAARP